MPEKRTPLLIGTLQKLMCMTGINRGWCSTTELACVDRLIWITFTNYGVTHRPLLTENLIIVWLLVYSVTVLIETEVTD